MHAKKFGTSAHDRAGGLDLAQRILAQRMDRFPDTGPDLRAGATARFRREAQRLRVGFARLPRGMASDTVRRVKTYAQPRAMQIVWVVLPHQEGERELPPVLTHEGFSQTEHLLLMGHAGPVVIREDPRITIKGLDTWDEMCSYERGSRISFSNESLPIAEVVRMRASDRWREQQLGWCDYYSASLNGDPVAGCYVTRYEEVPTLMGVYTLPAARGQGVATALVSAVLRQLHEQGQHASCLFVRHGNPAERIYRRLGFFPICDEDTWLWDPWHTADDPLLTW